jgi:hypothetical protein
LWLAGGLYYATFLNNIAYSYDGVNWNGLYNTPITGTNSYIRSIAWSPNLEIWVAVGYTGSAGGVQYSYDGFTWILVSTTLFTTAGYGVSWGEDKFVACGAGTNSKIWYSYDGINWVASIVAVFATNAISAFWSGTKWVVTGTSNNTSSIAYSYDGISWTLAQPAMLNATATIYGGVAWSQSLGIWVACGTVIGSGNQGVYYSYDGINWTPPSTSILLGCTSVVWAGNRFVLGYGVAANNGGVYYSADGLTWTVGTNTTATNVYGLCWSNNLPNIIIRQPTLAFGSGTNTIAYSYDGIRWTGLGSTVFTTIGYNACWNGNIWVAVGEGTNEIAYSYDGINWSRSTSGNALFTSARGVAWNGILFVAVGTNSGVGAVAYSYDGINWSSSGINITSGNFPATCYCVAWGQKYFILGGQSGSTFGTNNMAYSTNGITWTPITGQFGTSASGGCYSLVCGNGRWVAVGGISFPNTVTYYTNDPTSTWTSGTGTGISTTGVFYSVTFGIYPTGNIGLSPQYAYRYVLTGANQTQNFYSSNGANWTATTTTILGSNNSSAVNWNGKRFIAGTFIAASSATLLYSYDAATWYTSTYSTGFNSGAVLFTSSITGFASSPQIGSVYVDNSLTISQTSGLNTSQQLDVYSDTYFNNGYNNATITIKSNSYQI